MPQASYPYAVTRVRSLEARMLDLSKFARLKEAGEAEALKLLIEWGYAQGNSVEALITAQMEQTRRVIWEITPNEPVTSLFLLPIDAHNIKALLKARLLGAEASVLLPGGLFDPAMLAKAVHDKDYKSLPENFRDALSKVERSIAQKIDPRVISALVDKAVFEYVNITLSKSPEKLIKQYFAAQSDFINVRSVMRARAMKWGKDKLEQMLIPGGTLMPSALTESLELPADALSKKLGTGVNGRVISSALDDYSKNGDTVALERWFDSKLLELVKNSKNDAFTLAPIIGYLLGREAEAKALRVLFAAKRAGSEPILPALYA